MQSSWFIGFVGFEIETDSKLKGSIIGQHDEGGYPLDWLVVKVGSAEDKRCMLHKVQDLFG